MKKGLFVSFVILLLVASQSCERIETPQDGKLIKVRVTAVDTKSEAMTTNGLKAEGHFVLDAFLDDPWNDYETYPDDDPDHPRYGTTAADRYYIKSNGAYNVKYGSTDWYIEDSNGKESYKWIANDVTRFWCRWPADADVDAASEGIRTITTAPASGSTAMSFSYVLPTPGSGTVRKDAENQKDLLFAYAQRNFKKNEDDGIDIKFNHPLSEVKFCVSPDDGTYDVNLTIKRIVISNVKSSGECLFTAGGTIDAGTMFEWDSWGTPLSYAQDYDVSFATSLTVAPAGWTVSQFGTATPKKHVVTSNVAFMMIPQTLAYTSAGASTNSTISVTFGNTGTGADITQTAELGSTEWKPGHYYTYKIKATTVSRSIDMIVVLDEWGNFEDKLIVTP